MNEQDIARGEALVTRFAGQAAHDLQEPLRLLSGYLDLLCAHLDGKVELDGPRLAREARETAERMQRLVASLLEFSRIANAPRMDAPVQLEDALADAEANLRLRINETHANVAHGPLPLVRGDRAQLSRMFQNLIENSLKYADRGKRPVVRVDAQRVDGGWVIPVDDNGPGWPARGRERLFLPFTRLHGGDVPGQGIGLATVRAIVEQHAGHVSAKDAPEGGARVEIWIPVMP